MKPIVGGLAELKISYVNFGEVIMAKGARFEVLAVYPDGCVHLAHPETGGRVLFTAKEVIGIEPLPEWATSNDQRYFRVSAFAIGYGSFRDTPLVHGRSTKPENIQKRFRELCKHLGEKYGAVVLHQGNLMHNSHKMHDVQYASVA